MKKHKKIIVTIFLCGLFSLPVLANDFSTYAATSIIGSVIEKIIIWVSSIESNDPCDDNDNDGCGGGPNRPKDRPIRPTN